MAVSPQQKKPGPENMLNQSFGFKNGVDSTQIFFIASEVLLQPFGPASCSCLVEFLVWSCHLKCHGS